MVLQKYDGQDSMVIDTNGFVNDNLNFQFGDDTSTYYGCGATLKGEFWFFGGNHGTYIRQVNAN